MPSSVSTIETKQNLTADCWAEAALDAIAGGGLDAVAVEPLARRLGVTKGSFYWHFANRDALLRAALPRWERTEPAAIVPRIRQEYDASVRSHTLLQSANARFRAGLRSLAFAAAPVHPWSTPFVPR